MQNEHYIDRIFRGYGEEFFGKEFMDKLTSEQIETARCESFKLLQEKIEYLISVGYKHTESDEITDVKELFCNYIFENYC